MKILKVKAKGFKNCADDFCMDFLAKSKKTSEDKEYELLEIDEELYVYSTVGIVGKNASGKTSALELLDWCYDILSVFRLGGKKTSYHDICLEIYFYESNCIYRYVTELDDSDTLEDTAVFKNQKLYGKQYHKTKLRQIWNTDWMEEVVPQGEVPEDVSAVFFILRKSAVREIYYGALKENEDGYSSTFKFMNLVRLDPEYLIYILRIFDDNISDLRQVGEKRFLVNYQGEEKALSSGELYRFLSSGTTKGINLYILAAASLKMGFDLIVDEIENHFHKTLVENLILLYKDKEVNKKNATLYFSTHYCELLDLFHRSDNIWVTHSDGKVTISNMYDRYGIRTELLKSRKFYQNAFDTAVNYEALMELKRELMK